MCVDGRHAAVRGRAHHGGADLLLREAIVHGGPVTLLFTGTPVAEGFALDLDLAGLASLVDLSPFVAEAATDPMDRLVATGLCRRLAAFIGQTGLGVESPAGDEGSVVVRNADQTVMAVGLTKADTLRLLGDWRDERPAVRLSTVLSLADVGDMLLFGVARCVLRALDQAGRVTKATPKGNLTRKFVAERVERASSLIDDSGYLREPSEQGKLNEEDLWELHIARIVLCGARLVARNHNTLRLTRKGRGLLADDRAEALYELPFRTFSRWLNLAYLDPLPIGDEYQQMIGVSLFCLHAFGERWRREEELAELLVPPALRPALGLEHPQWGPQHVAETRLLHPLRWFGLVEYREVGKEDYRRIEEVRKMPLFDQFISFDLGQEESRLTTHPPAPGVH